MAIQLEMNFGVKGVEQSASSIKNITDKMNENILVSKQNNFSLTELKNTTKLLATNEQIALANSLKYSKIAMEESIKVVSKYNDVSLKTIEKTSYASNANVSKLAGTNERSLATATEQVGKEMSKTKKTVDAFDASMKKLTLSVFQAIDVFRIVYALFNQIQTVAFWEGILKGAKAFEFLLDRVGLSTEKLKEFEKKIQLIIYLINKLGIEEEGLINVITKHNSQLKLLIFYHATLGRAVDALIVSYQTFTTIIRTTSIVLNILISTIEVLQSVEFWIKLREYANAVRLLGKAFQFNVYFLDLFIIKLDIIIEMMKMFGEQDEGILTILDKNSNTIRALIFLYQNLGIVVSISSLAFGMSIIKMAQLDKAFIAAKNNTRLFEFALRDVSNYANSLQIKETLYTKTSEMFIKIENKFKEIITNMSKISPDSLLNLFNNIKAKITEVFGKIGGSIGGVFQKISPIIDNFFKTNTIGVYINSLYNLGKTLTVAVGYPLAATTERLIRANASWVSLNLASHFFTLGLFELSNKLSKSDNAVVRFAGDLSFLAASYMALSDAISVDQKTIDALIESFTYLKTGAITSFNAIKIALNDFKAILENNLAFTKAFKYPKKEIIIEAKIGETWKNIESSWNPQRIISFFNKLAIDITGVIKKAFDLIYIYANAVFKSISEIGTVNWRMLWEELKVSSLASFYNILDKADETFRNVKNIISTNISVGLKKVFSPETFVEFNNFKQIFKDETLKNMPVIMEKLFLSLNKGVNTLKIVSKELPASFEKISTYINIARKDAETFSAISSHFFQKSKSGLIALGEGAEAMQVGFLGAGAILTQFDSIVIKTVGYIAILAGLLAGGLAAAIQMALGSIGEALSALGNKMQEKMNLWVEKFQKAEVAVKNFEFTVKAMSNTFGKATAGTIASWTQFIDEMEKKSVWDVTSLRKMVQEIVSVGSALKMNNAQQEMLARMIVDQAKAGDDLFDTTVAFVQALNGMGQGVVKYGLHISDTAMMHSNFAKSLGRPIEQLNDYEKAAARLAVMLEQSRVVEGKSQLQLETMAGVLANVEKAHNRLGIAMGQQGQFTALYYRIQGMLIDSFSRFPPEVMQVVGSFWDLFSILSQLAGNWLSHAMIIAGIITAYKMIKFAVAEVVIVQTILNTIFAYSGTVLGVQMVAVTSLTAVWSNLALVLKTVVVTSFATIGTMLMESVIRIKALTVAFLTNPLVWKITAIVSAVYLLYRAFEQLEAKTKVFSNFLDRLGASLNRIGSAFAGSAEKINFLDKALLFLKAFIASLIDVFEILVSTIISAVAGALYLFTKWIETSQDVTRKFMKILGLTSTTFDEVSESVREFNKILEDTVSIVSNNAQRTIADLYHGVDRLGLAYGDTKNAGASFNDGINAITDSLKKNTTELDKAKLSLEAIGKEYIVAQAKGQDFKAGLLKMGELEASKKVAKLEGTGAEGEAKTKLDVKVKDLDNEMLKTQTEIQKKIEDTQKSAEAIELEQKVKVLLDAKDFKGAMELELANNAEIRALQEQITPIAPMRASSEEASKAYDALTKKLASIQTKIAAEYKEKESNFRKEQMAATIETQGKIADLTGDATAKLQAQRDADMAENEKALKDKLRTQEEYEKMKVSIEDKYQKDAIEQSKNAEIEKLKAQQETLKKSGEPEDPEITRQIEAQELQKTPGLDEKQKDAITQQQLYKRDLEKISQDTDKFMTKMKDTLAQEFPNVIVPRDIFDALKELDKSFYEVGMGIEGGEAKLQENTKKYNDAMTNFANIVKKDAEELKKEGKIIDAKKLEEDWKEYQAKMAAEVMPGMKKIVEDIIKNSAAAQKGIVDDTTPEKVKKKIQEPMEKALGKVQQAIQKTGAKFKEFEETVLSVFDTIDLTTVEGVTEAAGQMIKNFEKITPGNVVEQIFIKMFGNAGAFANVGRKLIADGQKKMANAFAGAKWDFGSFLGGAGTALKGVLLTSFQNAGVWGAIVEFFGKDIQGFKKQLADKLKSFEDVFFNMADNIPTFFVSVLGRAFPILLKMITGLVKLVANLVAMIPVILARIMTEAAKALIDFPNMFGNMLREVGTNMEQGVYELYTSIATMFGSGMNSITRGIIGGLSTLWNAYINLTNQKLYQGLKEGERVARKIVFGIQSLSAIAVQNMQALAERADGSINKSVVKMVGGFRALSGVATAVTEGINKNWSGLAIGIAQMTEGILIALSANSEKYAVWAYRVILLTTLVVATTKALQGDYAGAFAAGAEGAAMAGSILATTGKKALKDMEAAQKTAQEKSQKWMAYSEAQAEKQKELEGTLFDSKRVGSAEFKVKEVSVQDEKVKEYSLATVENVMAAAGEIGDLITPDPKSMEMKMPDMSAMFGDIKKNMEAAVLAIGLALAVALAPVFPVVAIIVGAIAVFTAIVMTIVKYWDEIVAAVEGFFNTIGDFFAESASKFWNYITSGQFLTDVMNVFYAVGNFIDQWVIQPLLSFVTAVGTVFRLIYDTILAPIIELFKGIWNNLIGPGLKQFYEWILSGFTWVKNEVFQPIMDFFSLLNANVFIPIIDGIKAAFTWINDEIFKPIINSFYQLFNFLDANVFQPIIDKFNLLFTTLDEYVFQPIGRGISAVFKPIVQAFKDIGDGIAFIFKPIIDGLKWFVDKISTPFQWIYDNIIKPIIDFNPVKKAGGALNKAGDAIAGVFGWAHGGVVGQYAHGGVIRAAGGMMVPGLAGGGNNFGRDIVPAMLSAGEWVLPNSITQDGNLMSDIGRLISGETTPSPSITNVANTSSTEQNFTININIASGARMTKQDVERELMPTILEGIKDATKRGKQIVNTRGVYT